MRCWQLASLLEPERYTLDAVQDGDYMMQRLGTLECLSAETGLDLHMVVLDQKWLSMQPALPK